MRNDDIAQPAADLTEDLFLDGRLRLTQPARGYRAGTDALLLAAAARNDAETAHRIADAGAGVGTVGLALALQLRQQLPAAITLIERDPVFAACARKNICSLGAGEGLVALEEIDLFDRAAVRRRPALSDQTFDLVVTNPPYDQALRGRRTPNPLKMAAHAMRGGDLNDWLSACARLLKHGGVLTMIHRADMLDDILPALPSRLGGISIRPVHARTGEPATRILVRAVAGSRACLSLLPPMVLHDDAGQFTPEAQAVHEGRAAVRLRP